MSLMINFSYFLLRLTVQYLNELLRRSRLVSLRVLNALKSYFATYLYCIIEPTVTKDTCTRPLLISVEMYR